MTLYQLKYHFEQQLQAVIDVWTAPSVQLLDAMRYMMLAPSKRLRPLLVYAVGEVVELSPEWLDAPALSVEFMHTYSLVHDDLPAMDDDDVRRGQPSCHIKYGEAMAVLVGDALQGIAFETLLSAPLSADHHKVTMALQLQQAAGYQGMISGQIMDINELSDPSLTLDRLRQIHLFKTAALIQLCVKLPMILAKRLDPVVKKRLEQVGLSLGIAFQMQDDYLDRYGDSDRMGKPRGSDEQSDKKTFVDFYDKQTLAGLFNDHYQHAHSHAEALGASSLCELIALVCEREV